MEDINGEAVEAVDSSRGNDLCIEELRSCPLFAQLSDKQAAEVLDTLKKYTQIIFDCYQQNSREK